jgi:amino acid transporter
LLLRCTHNVGFTGGSYGTEDLAGAIPPLFALLGILIVPWLFSLPISLMTAELATAMPDKGGFFVWIQSMGNYTVRY